MVRGRQDLEDSAESSPVEIYAAENMLPKHVVLCARDLNRVNRQGWGRCHASNSCEGFCVLGWLGWCALHAHIAQVTGPLGDSTCRSPLFWGAFSSGKVELALAQELPPLFGGAD